MGFARKLFSLKLKFVQLEVLEIVLPKYEEEKITTCEQSDLILFTSVMVKKFE
jgi:hypothetical protein